MGEVPHQHGGWDVCRKNRGKAAVQSAEAVAVAVICLPPPPTSGAPVYCSMVVGPPAAAPGPCTRRRNWPGPPLALRRTP